MGKSVVPTDFVIPTKLVPVFNQPAMIRGAYGGRASTKTSTFCAMAALRGYHRPMRILCGREIQSSIDESVKHELEVAINRYPFLKRHYIIQEQSIFSPFNGTEFLFQGLRYNLNSKKSLSDIDLTYIDEADDISEIVWEKFIPTVVRKPGSELWLTWNPEKEFSATDQRFKKSCPDESIIVECNWRDNPWFSRESNNIRLADKKRDPEKYLHVWEGGYKRNNHAIIFNGKWRINEFKPGKDWHGPYQGLDFGFSTDPTAAVRCWIHDGRLFIEYDFAKLHLELDKTVFEICQAIPDFHKHDIRADSARPESISFLRRFGFPRIQPVIKWPGSVEDGIEHIKTYTEVIVHPRCVPTISELASYSFKIDKNTNLPTSDIVDANNHNIDAARYALAPMIRQNQIFVGSAS